MQPRGQSARPRACDPTAALRRRRLRREREPSPAWTTAPRESSPRRARIRGRSPPLPQFERQHARTTSRREQGNDDGARRHVAAVDHPSLGRPERPRDRVVRITRDAAELRRHFTGIPMGEYRASAHSPSRSRTQRIRPTAPSTLAGLFQHRSHVADIERAREPGAQLSHRSEVHVRLLVNYCVRDCWRRRRQAADLRATRRWALGGT